MLFQEGLFLPKTELHFLQQLKLSRHINKIVLNINVLLSSENSLQALHALSSMKYSADLTINVHKKCEKSPKIEISAISSQKYWHTKIFLYINHTKPEFSPKFSCSHLWSDFHETWTSKSRIK